MANSGGGGWVVVGLLGLAIYNCSGSGTTEPEEREYSPYASQADESGLIYNAPPPDSTWYAGSVGDVVEEEGREEFDEDAAREAAEEEVASDSYAGIGMPYGCTIDCSGHEAGFAWRRDNGYAAPGTSPSFEEGGAAFDEAVEERVDEMRDAYDAGEDPDY